jgi:hypothetical protein
MHIKMLKIKYMIYQLYKSYIIYYIILLKIIYDNNDIIYYIGVNICHITYMIS